MFEPAQNVSVRIVSTRRRPRGRQSPAWAVIVMCLGLSPLVACAAGPFKVTRLDDRVRVEIDGKLFTQYIFKGYAKPICYPIMGPKGEFMVRHWPVEPDFPGEQHDHPHHKSLWFGLESIDGYDFWTDVKNFGRTEQTKLDKAEGGDTAVIQADNKWVAPTGKVVCTDTRTITCSLTDDGDRVIDYVVTMHASDGDIHFGDRKDGLLGIRTCPQLRIDHGAHAVNSEGVTGKPIWGKRANWVDYSATVDGHTVGVSLFDNPLNMRHPTWWHAREYGLIGPNPFGISYFEHKPRGTGDYTLPAGKSITFRYRLIFHEGDVDAAHTAERYKAYAAAAEKK